jgi:replication initiation and membrane attachment protein DnaB
MTASQLASTLLEGGETPKQFLARKGLSIGLTSRISRSHYGRYRMVFAQKGGFTIEIHEECSCNSRDVFNVIKISLDGQSTHKIEEKLTRLANFMVSKLREHGAVSIVLDTTMSFSLLLSEILKKHFGKPSQSYNKLVWRIKPLPAP